MNVNEKLKRYIEQSVFPQYKLNDKGHQIEHIKSLFHISGGNGMPQFNVVHDNPEFSAWKQEVQFELQDIYDRTNDNFIWIIFINIFTDCKETST